MIYLKRFNESALPMPRVVNKEEAFELSGRERVDFKSTEIDTVCRILIGKKFKDVTEKYWFSPDATNRWLIADQFDEVRNYLETI